MHKDYVTVSQLYSHQVATCWEDPVVISLIGTEDMKTGVMMSVMDEMKSVASELSKVTSRIGG
jgi:hypothetical protein